MGAFREDALERGSREELVRQSAQVEAALRRAARQALIDHKRTGDPIVVVRDGQVCWVPADEIVIPDDPDAADAEASGR